MPKGFLIDNNTGEIVSENNKRTSCKQKEAKEFVCFKVEDIFKLKSCNKF